MQLAQILFDIFDAIPFSLTYMIVQYAKVVSENRPCTTVPCQDICYLRMLFTLR